MAVEDPVGTFGASVKHVTDLLPQATFPETLSPGQKGVTQAMVTGYLTEVDRRVAFRLVERAKLTDEDRKAALAAAARDLVANGAASYAQAARFPEQARPNSDGYAALLWSRFTTGLDELAAQLDGWLDDADDATQDASSTPGWSFPPASVTDGLMP